MTYEQTLLLAFLQAATEFLPVSSAAHLVLVPHFLAWKLQELSFDIVVHIGTLAGLLSYYCKSFARGSPLWRGAPSTKKLTVLAIFASLPLFAVGYLVAPLVETYLRSPTIIAYATIIFAIVLLFAEKVNSKKNAPISHTLTFKHAFFIGCAQVLALIPGASRSGVTLSAGLLLGLDKESAAHFSFIMAAPAIGGAAAYLLVSSELSAAMELTTLLVGFFVSALFAALSIGLFLKLLKRFGLLPFVIYRLMLGGAILSVY